MSNRFHATVYLSLVMSKKCIIKQLLDSVFVISGIIRQGLGKCYQPRPSARQILNTDLDLDYSEGLNGVVAFTVIG